MQRTHVFSGPTVRRAERTGARPPPPQRTPVISQRDKLDSRHKEAPAGSGLERWVLHAVVGLLAAGVTSAFFLLQGNWGSPLATTPVAAVNPAKSGARFPGGNDPNAALMAGGGREVVGSIERGASLRASRPAQAEETDAPASVIARRWQGYLTEFIGPAVPKAGPAPKEGMRLASIEAAPPPRSVIRSAFPPDRAIPRIPLDGNSKTALVEFQTAPFPYSGTMPGSDRPFLDAGEAGHKGHTNFRGHVLWESETFGDPRVLLHIPPAFDPNRPGVMVVFFHGHGANLARDVRDRQQVPAQITASGVNAVLVAPQFAFNAADSSSGKFWEPNGFKRFLDEAASQLAKLDGDPKSAAAFANMPIVIVAYSGGYGPTLSVLDRGGANARIRGIVLMDALYTGMGRFASWIASNRSGFFVSSFTPHNHGRNVELEELLNERSISYQGELRQHLPGSVSIISAGDISHRDFVNRAWAESPLKDILVRLDDMAPRVQIAGPQPGTAPVAASAALRHD